MKKLLSIFALLLISAVTMAQEKVTVSPTYKEAMHYANLTGQKFWTWVAIVLFVGFLVYLFLIAINFKNFTFNGWLTLVWLSLALGAWRGKPTACWLNNNKEVEKTYLEKVGRKYILDSCFNNNLMQNAAVK